MYDFGEFIRGLVGFAIFSVIVLLPLAVWKAVEIVIWLINHVEVTV